MLYVFFPFPLPILLEIFPSVAFCFHEQIQHEVNVQTLSTAGGKWARIGEWHWVGEWHVVGSAMTWRLRKECAEKVGEEHRNVSDCEGGGPHMQGKWWEIGEEVNGESNLSWYAWSIKSMAGWHTREMLSKEVSCAIWCSFDVREQDKSLWDFFLLLLVTC